MVLNFTWQNEAHQALVGGISAAELDGPAMWMQLLICTIIQPLFAWYCQSSKSGVVLRFAEPLCHAVLARSKHDFMGLQVCADGALSAGWLTAAVYLPCLLLSSICLDLVVAAFHASTQSWLLTSRSSCQYLIVLVWPTLCPSWWTSS